MLVKMLLGHRMITYRLTVCCIKTSQQLSTVSSAFRPYRHASVIRRTTDAFNRPGTICTCKVFHTERHLSTFSFHRNQCHSLPGLTDLKGRPTSFRLQMQRFPRDTVLYIPRRTISLEAYNKWFSPEVFPIGLAQNVCETVHDFTGMPWWLSITVVTLSLRFFVMLPLSVMGIRNQVKVANINQGLSELFKQLDENIKIEQFKHNWTDKQAEMVKMSQRKRILADFYRKESCHPAKTLVATLCQLHVWLAMTFALRNMSGTPVMGALLTLCGFLCVETPLLCPDMATEGVLWFPSLLLPDTTLVLPLLVGLAQYLNIKTSYTKPEKPKLFEKVLLVVLKVAPFWMFFISSVVPTCMSYYWFCSALFGLIQNLLFKVPEVKKQIAAVKFTHFKRRTETNTKTATAKTDEKNSPPG